MFLILIAVALFAALSYAVTSSGRSGGAEVSKEKSALAAAQAIEYGALLQSAIDRLRVVNGCNDYQISFENTNVTGYANATAPTDRRCHVFDPAGGGLTLATPSALVSDATPWFFRSVRVAQVGRDQTFCVETASNPCNDLLAFFKGVSNSVCSDINNKLLKTTAITTQDNGTGFDSIKFTGVYSSGVDLDGTNVSNRYAACTKGVDGINYFFTVLIAR